MARGEYVRVRTTRKTTYRKMITPTGEIYEVESGKDTPATDKEIGWRTEAERVCYKMPLTQFLELAELDR